MTKNEHFYWLLHAVKAAGGKRPLWTVAKIADEIYCSRCSVNKAFNGQNGSQLRRKLVRFFKKHFPDPADPANTTYVPTWKEFLKALGWDEHGGIVPRGTCDVEQKAK